MLPLRIAGLSLVLATCFSSRLLSQPPVDTQIPASTQTVEQIQARIEEIEQSADLADDVKATLKGIYEQAAKQLADLADEKTATEAFQQKTQAAAAEIETARGAEPVEKIALPEDDLPLDKLSEKVKELDGLLQEKRRQLSLLTTEPARRAAWNALFPQETQQLETAIEAKKTLVASAPDGDDATATAKHALATAELLALEQKLRRYQKEKDFYSATTELIRLQTERLATEVSLLEQSVEAWRTAANKQREAEAVVQQDKVLTVLEDIPVELKAVAEENAALASDLTQLTRDMTTASADLDELRGERDKVAQQYTRSRAKIESIGMSDATGRYLRSERTTLPDVRKRRRDRRARQSKLQDARFASYLMQNRWTDLTVLEEAVKVEWDRMNLGVLAVKSDLFKDLSRLLEQRRELLRLLAEDYETYSQLLLDIDVTEQQLIQATNEYSDFIESYVFWTRSSPMVSHRDTLPAVDAARWLADIGNWQQLGDDAIATARLMLWAWAPFALLFGYLLRIRGQLRTWISSHCCHEEGQPDPTFSTMFTGLVATAVIALPWPALLWFVGWQLNRSLASQEFTRAVASGLIAAGWMLYPLEFFRQLLRPRGIAQASFHWPEESLIRLRGRARELLYLAVPLYAITIVLETQPVEPLWHQSLGRLVFVILMAVISMMLFLITRAKLRTITTDSTDRNASLARRARKVLALAIVLTPIALSVLALLGYHSTAQSLAQLFFETMVVLVLVLILVEVVEQLLLAAQRQVARREARAAAGVPESQSASPIVDRSISDIDHFRPAENALSNETDEPGELGEPGETDDDATPETTEAQERASRVLPVVEEERIDVVQLGSQARRLLHLAALLAFVAGCWGIWSDVLPAFSLIDKLTLPGLTNVTGGMLVRAAISLLITVVAVRNVAGLLEFSVLRHFSIDSGARYAAGMLARYVILGFGLWLIGSSLGVSWSSLQWLIAAMGVGLGFGLQEIFANFTSGIILLFERPVRVGDVITVDGNTGAVKTIRMRSTTITGWDRKDYVIPNKDLITGRLLNWTLSDEVQRIKIDVGVAYGSDTVRARELLIEIANEHPIVLDDPPPVSAFEAFGDSALLVSLRCFVPSLTNYLRTITELNTAIDAAFKEASLEIPFPQRDVHIRSSDSPDTDEANTSSL